MRKLGFLPEIHLQCISGALEMQYCHLLGQGTCWDIQLSQPRETLNWWLKPLTPSFLIKNPHPSCIFRLISIPYAMSSSHLCIYYWMLVQGEVSNAQEILQLLAVPDQSFTHLLPFFQLLIGSGTPMPSPSFLPCLMHSVCLCVWFSTQRSTVRLFFSSYLYFITAEKFFQN